MLFWEQQHFYHVRSCVIRQGDSVEYAKCVTIIIDKFAVFPSIFETKYLCCHMLCYAGFWTEATEKL